MTNYWIFVVTDQRIGNEEMMGKDIFNKCIEDKFWGIGERTPNRKRLKKGDMVTFYLGGREGQKFLGSCKLDSRPILVSQLNEKERKRLNRPSPFFDAEYGVYLSDVEVWDEPRRIQSLLPNLDFIRDKERFWLFLQGGVRAISEDDYNAIVSPTTRKVKEEIEDETAFVLEKYLKEFILSNWKSIFGSKLKLFKDEEGNTGENYPTSVGYPDFLCVDKSTKDFVVIELKKGMSSDKVVGQISRYMGWIQGNLAKEGQKVRGIIITKDYDEKLMYAVSAIPSVQVKFYKIRFMLTDKT